MRRNPKIEEAPLQGELILYDPGSAKFFVLNKTMAFAWRHCDRAPDDMVETLRQEFAEVEPATAEGDLREAIDQLCNLGLLEAEVTA